MRNSARRAITAIAITAVVGLFGAIPALAAPANPQNTTQVVTNSDVVRQPENTPPTGSWVLYNRNAGTGTFVDGPATG